MSSRTIAFAASTCPAVAQTLDEQRAGLVGGFVARVRYRQHGHAQRLQLSRLARHCRSARRRARDGQIVRHAHGVFAAVVVRGLAPRLPEPKLLVERLRAVVVGAQLEMHREDACRSRRRLEPLEQLPPDALALVTRLDGEQIQVRMDRVELHDREADDAAPVASREHDAIAVAQAALDALLVPRPCEPVLDELPRHCGNRRRLVDVGQT